MEGDMSNFVEWSDIDVKFTKSRTGNIRIVEGEDAINQSIKLTLSIMSGEKVLSSIGSGLYALLFNPISDETYEEIQSIIETNLSRFDNRIIVERVSVRPNLDQKYYEISVVYRITPSMKKKNMTTFMPALGDF